MTPAIDRDRLWQAHMEIARVGATAEGGSNRPLSSVICMRCSQASNSGARRRPIVWRRNSASWKEVLW